MIIIFKQEGAPDVKVPAEKGENLLALAQRAGVAVDAPCAGSGTCGKCRMKLIAGSVETARSPHLSREDYREGWRLACQSTVNSDATLWLPSQASAFKEDIRTADLGSEEELRRYEAQIAEILGDDAAAGGDIAADSAAADRAPGKASRRLGVAVDIGTTTVTAALLELSTGEVLAKASLGNGQIRYGADVINRIIQQSRPGGREKLRRAVREETVLPILARMCAEAGCAPEEIERFVIAGNTTMEHLFTATDAESIRLEPFVPAFLELHGKTARELGLADSDAPVILAPNVGSYVGGDITAGVLASGLWKRGENTLFVDLGTNGELVFGNSDFLLCCACSAGPAFEGGDISCGMRATTGAVEACELDPETLAPTLSVIGGGKPLGLCGSGLIAMIGELYRVGAIDARGKFIRENPRITRDEYDGAAFTVATAEESGTGRPIELDESDVDDFIRAKAAIFSAVRTMLGSLGMTVADIDRVILAGGIGSGIDKEKAIFIGMLPRLPLERFSYIGNSSLTGACAMLFSEEACGRAFELGRSMTYLELSTEPSYMGEFIAACFLPHTDRGLFEG